MFLVALPQYPAIEARAPGIYPSLKLFDEYMNVTEIVSQYPSSQTQGVGRRLGRLQSARRFNCRKPTRVPRPACLPACLLDARCMTANALLRMKPVSSRGAVRGKIQFRNWYCSLQEFTSLIFCLSPQSWKFQFENVCQSLRSSKDRPQFRQNRRHRRPRARLRPLAPSHARSPTRTAERNRLEEWSQTAGRLRCCCLDPDPVSIECRLCCAPCKWNFPKKVTVCLRSSCYVLSLDLSRARKCDMWLRN